MRNLVRRLRGALAMGLTWAVAWGIAGLLIGVSSLLLPFLPWDGFFRIFDAPLPALAMPGFIGGILFSIVLGIVSRRRSLRDFSLRQFAAWGALGGLLLSLIPVTLVLLGLAHPEGSDIGIWQFTAIIAPPMTLLGAASGSGTLALARRGDDQGKLR